MNDYTHEIKSDEIANEIGTLLRKGFKVLSVIDDSVIFGKNIYGFDRIIYLHIPEVMDRSEVVDMIKDHERTIYGSGKHI